MKHILLAEDDFDYGSILKQYLEISGFKVTWAKDGEEANELFADTEADICVLDVMMPKMDGFTLAENIITKKPEMPFIFLTAKGLKEDRIKGLKLGADDYIIKPFEADELILRIQNIIKRSKGIKQESIEEDIITIGSYTFLPGNYILQHPIATHRLTEKESQLLHYLYTNRNKVIKREEILMEVWGNNDFFSGRSMDVFISRIRKYFTEDTSIALTAIRGIGLEFSIAKQA